MVRTGSASVAAGPTLAVVAREAGVSVPTASKVVNGREDVAPETRRRVTEALDRLGYVRRPRFDTVRTPRLVDLVVHSLDSSRSGAVLHGVEEAARIDGAGELRIFFSIVLRMMTTGGATVFLLAFVNTWNAFFLPLTVLRGEENWTLNLGLYNWSGKRLESGVDLTSLVLTGALLSIVPMAIMMVAMRRYWRTGVTLGALK